MAEQLAGQWYANLTGLGDLVPAPMRKSALQRVYERTEVARANSRSFDSVNGLASESVDTAQDDN
jgi:non-lysosomal glucosylceramidase